MQRHLTKLTVFAFLAAAISVAPSVTPVYAQGGYGKPAVDCTSPAMKNDPACLALKKNKGKPAGVMGGAAVTTTPSTQTTTQMTTQNTKSNTQTTTTTNTQGSVSINIGSNGFFNFTPRQHDEFRQRFHSFNFGFFPAPTFSIFLGTVVPHYYYPRLHRVPYSIWRFYPQFRGYFFFVTRQGDIVIVSPRSYRIVAIL